jgi:hypothetical protein
MANLTKGQKIYSHIVSLQNFIKDKENIELKKNDESRYYELMDTKFKQLKDKYNAMYVMASSKVFDERDEFIVRTMMCKIDEIEYTGLKPEDANNYVKQSIKSQYS